MSVLLFISYVSSGRIGPSKLGWLWARLSNCTLIKVTFSMFSTQVNVAQQGFSNSPYKMTVMSTLGLALKLNTKCHSPVCLGFQRNSTIGSCLKYEQGTVFAYSQSSLDHISFVSAQTSHGLEESSSKSVSKRNTDEWHFNSMSSLIPLLLVKTILIVIFL